MIEEFVILGGENERLLDAKQEFFGQISEFRISIKAKGFFEVDRPFLASVRYISKRRSVFSSFKYNSSPF